MSHLPRVAAALIVSGALAALATAQQPTLPYGQAPGTTQAGGPRAKAALDAAALETSLYQRRSIVHHNPRPYPNYYTDDSQAGFRNPGGVGRTAEYYPPGDRFQVEGDPVRVAKFDQGGGAPDRAEQIQAQNAGTARYNAIQGSIDNYARPYMGYGLGVGSFGGFY